jgi:hypothetical protein
MHTINAGDVYASSHAGDRARGERQRRIVTEYDGHFVTMRTWDAGSPVPTGPISRIRVRQTLSGPVVPGHKPVTTPAPQG